MKKSRVNLAGFVLGLALTTGAMADTPVGARVDNVSYAGSGCAAYSTSARLNSAADELKIELENFILQTGLTIPRRDQRKNCHIYVNLKIPLGWSYSLSEVSYSAVARLATGSIGFFSSRYYFQGSQATARFEAKVTGPIYDYFTVKDNLRIAALVWSPCGVQRGLMLNTEGRIDTSSSRDRRFDNLITVEESPMDHRFKLVWRRC